MAREFPWRRGMFVNCYAQFALLSLLSQQIDNKSNRRWSLSRLSSTDREECETRDDRQVPLGGGAVCHGNAAVGRRPSPAVRRPALRLAVVEVQAERHVTAVTSRDSRPPPVARPPR